MNHRHPLARAAVAACIAVAWPALPAWGQATPQPQPAPQPTPTPSPTPTPERLYTLGPFDGVEVTGGAATIRFTQGTTDQVVVKGDDSRQQSVAVEVRGDTLRIRPAGAWKFWGGQRLEIEVTARLLRRVMISGAADWYAPAPVEVDQLTVNISGAGLARFDRLKADRLNFQVSGSGDGQAAGSVKDLNVRISGRSEFRGEGLVSERAKVSISGIGDVKVWALDDLMISIAGVGTVDYWGAPLRLQRSVSGQASINDRGAKRVAGSDRPTRSEPAARTEQVERSERTERVERAERVERYGWPQRPERPERPERVERPRTERPDRAEPVTP